MLVDTRQPGRIGRLAELLEKTGLDIHIYDHHPPGDGDIRGRLEVCAPTGANVTLLIEAINTRDIPGFYLNYSAQAFDIMHYANVPNLAFQYDIYHMQIMEGDLAPTMEKNLSKIGHMQLADTPGRHEPGTGEINYPFLFDFIDRIGYKGWIGCEYRPAGKTVDGLGWAKKYL